jgi:phosphoribosylformimino-5-aminoimidazole carboxamide ribotide isomerase
MRIYPAIDLKDGACVRLYKGDMNAATVYNADPAAQAKAFEAVGFDYLHIVDLNGAIDGRPVNEEAVKNILRNISIPAQLGGGIRTLQHIETWLEAGLARVILGTVAVKDPALVKEACKKFPQQIVLGIDAYADKVAVEGWVERSEMTIFDLAKTFEDAGAAALIYTDINRDGTGEGLNIDITQQLAQHVNIPVIASGGVGSIKDIENVKAANLDGVIVGRALYDGRVRAEEILNV